MEKQQDCTKPPPTAPRVGFVSLSTWWSSISPAWRQRHTARPQGTAAAAVWCWVLVLLVVIVLWSFFTHPLLRHLQANHHWSAQSSVQLICSCICHGLYLILSLTAICPRDSSASCDNPLSCLVLLSRWTVQKAQGEEGTSLSSCAQGADAPRPPSPIWPKKVGQTQKTGMHMPIAPVQATFTDTKSKKCP